MFLLLDLSCQRIGPWPVEEDNALAIERIAVTPLDLDFGAVSVNLQGSATLPITVYNLGEEAVTLTGHDEPIGDDEFRVDALPVLTIPAGASETLQVTFLPETEINSLARLRFQPGNEVVNLVGVGHSPVIHIGKITIPATVLGCEGHATVEVSNTGSEALYLDASVTGEDFVVTGWSPDMAPGETTEVEVRFTPGGGGARGGFLTLTSNDPLNPAVAIELSGLGYEGERVAEAFVYAPSDTTDVIFVVQGGCFSGDLRVDEAVESYAARAHGSWNDIHLTSISSASPCPSGPPEWTERGDSLLRMEHVLSDAFAGGSGPWDRDLVGLLGTSLGEMEAGGCLDGFRRPDASLDVVFVASDPPGFDALDAWTALGIADGVPARVSALVPRSAECGDPATSYAELAAARGGAVADLCASEWSGSFESFAALPSVNAEARYPLEVLPVPTTLSLTADGVAFTAWHYDDITNEVVMDAELRPAIDARIDVEYVSAVSCGTP